MIIFESLLTKFETNVIFDAVVKISSNHSMTPNAFCNYMKDFTSIYWPEFLILFCSLNIFYCEILTDITLLMNILS